MKKIQKTMWHNDKWCDYNYYELSSDAKLLAWIKEHYGSANYPTTWWKLPGIVWCREDIYIHWKLCE